VGDCGRTSYSTRYMCGVSPMSSRSGKAQVLDLSKENCERISKLLDEGDEVMKICKDCGVECDDEWSKIRSLRRLYEKMIEIHKREAGK